MGSGVELEGLELQLAPYLLEALAASGAGGVVLGTAHTQNSGAQVPEILTISLSETIIIGTASTVYSINNEFNQNSGKSIFGKIISGIASGLNAAWNILNNDSKNEADNKSTETTSGAETEATNEQSKAEQRAAKLSLKPRDGMDFTKAGKEAVIDVNKEKNGGKTVCVGCKTETVPAKKSEKGVTPPKNETQVDHIIRKREGGSGTPDNGQVLCRGCNLKKH
ncbi:HNH endonuclease [Empedobacter tilapiae]|uniref:HNH endonuclease n=2 Tax=Empedobacter tilapiae TaxID=2491114 RepID=A0A4Z1BHW8_9FLAO|nr:HNH endonuclease [Empedobacter tilapiae]